MILGTLEVGYIYLAKTELNRIAMQAARIVETGNAASLSQSQFGTAACGNLAVILQCNGLMISLTPQTSCASVTNTLPTLTYNSNGSVANVFNYSPGTGGQIMVIQLLYQLPVFGAGLLNFSSQSNGTLLISSTYVFANEP